MSLILSLRGECYLSRYVNYLQRVGLNFWSNGAWPLLVCGLAAWLNVSWNWFEKLFIIYILLRFYFVGL